MPGTNKLVELRTVHTQPLDTGVLRLTSESQAVIVRLPMGVAVIVVGPDGVEVKPIFDVTKFGLAVLTAWAAMLATAVRLRRATR